MWLQVNNPRLLKTFPPKKPLHKGKLRDCAQHSNAARLCNATSQLYIQRSSEQFNIQCTPKPRWQGTSDGSPCTTAASTCLSCLSRSSFVGRTLTGVANQQSSCLQEAVLGGNRARKPTQPCFIVKRTVMIDHASFPAWNVQCLGILEGSVRNFEFKVSLDTCFLSPGAQFA